jgi:predicted ester cyclase
VDGEIMTKQVLSQINSFFIEKYRIYPEFPDPAFPFSDFVNRFPAFGRCFAA